MKTKAILYWTTTTILALELLVGGAWDLARQHYVLEIMTRLGYPAYLLTILGIWKVLGAVALMVPRFPRLKEWAYAGIVFEMTGAAALHAARGESALNLIAPILFTILAFASWMVRPQSRVLGIIALPQIKSA